MSLFGGHLHDYKDGLGNEHVNIVEDDEREKAKDSPSYQIAAWQHDGFVVRPRYKTDQLARRFEHLVQIRAEEMGVPTSLEIELL